MKKEIEDLIRKIALQKDNLIFHTMLEKLSDSDFHSFGLDMQKEMKRRFPRILKEIHQADNSEHYYWNDGSEEGLRLISFYPNQEHDFLSINNEHKMTFGFTWK